jgi:hypothetical protein
MHFLERNRRVEIKITKKRQASKNTAPASKLISDYILRLSDWRGETLSKIRRCFRDADPEIVEEWKWMGSPTWSRNGLIAVANAHKKKVKLTFYQGARLPDPHKLFNADLEGKKWRAIDFAENDQLDESALKDLIRSAVALNNLSRSRGR